MAEPITVFTARTVRTMDESLPEASAVAVRDGRIVEVGSVETMEPWLSRHEHVIDDRFSDSVLLPGFIDPHVHPAMMAMLLATEWITPEQWDLPGRIIPATRGRDDYLERLRQFEKEGDRNEPLICFGFHAQFHGEVVRRDLDEISRDRPIVLWQRSFHELRANTAGLEWMNAQEGAAWDPHIDLRSGRLFESGMAWGLATLVPYLLAHGDVIGRLGGVRELVHRGGVTSIADAGYGIVDFDLELEAFKAEFGDVSNPFRLYMIPNVLIAKGKFGDEMFDRLEAFEDFATERLQFVRAAKFLADGAFIAQLMQVGPPGYIDGHEGAWLSDPEQLRALITPFWERGFDIHIHTNGDVGVAGCLDTIETLLHEHPRFDHRTTLHHFGVSTQAQIRRIAALGVSVQANGYYLRLFADAFVDQWLGAERAGQITRVGSAARAGVSVALHSDLPMGPVAPLLAASSLVTRTTVDGTVMGIEEALTPEQALAAITIEPAWQLRLDHDLGSLAAGKLADFTVLSADPLLTEPTDWAAIEIEATVVGGTVYPLPSQ